MKTKEEILSYCVYVGDDRELALQVSRQFERLGIEYEKRGLATKKYPWQIVENGRLNACTKEQLRIRMVTTFPELTAMIDEYLEGDTTDYHPYSKVRKFIKWQYPQLPQKNRQMMLRNFIEHETKLKPTMEELIAAYADSTGVKPEQVEPNI